MNYPQEKAPKIGIISTSIDVFSPEGKEAAENQMRQLFEKLKATGAIAATSLFFPHRIFGPLEAEKLLDRLVCERIDALVVLNSAFPHGNTFLTLATDPYLSKIPLIITAPPEFEQAQSEWSTNAYCGLVMNNCVAKQLGRPIFTLPGWSKEDDYQTEFRRILSVVYTVKEMRRDFLGKFGDAPGGFHSSSGDQIAYAALLGTRVETIDLAAVLETYHSAKAAGYKGEVQFTDQDVENTYRKMVTGKDILTDNERIQKTARLYHAFKALIEVNGFTSIAVRCWPEIIQVLDISSCLAIAWLASERIVWSAACEGDWPNAVCQSLGNLLSGQPAACLDFVNYIGGKRVVQMGHCGVGIPCVMVKPQIAEISPTRQAGSKHGPACIGQFLYGPKTGISLIQDRNRRFKMLVFTGENRSDTAQNLRYAAADVEIEQFKKLNELILEHGFPHHVAVAMGDISHELKYLCDFYGIEYLTPG